MKDTQSVSELAKVLAILGGILVLLAGILEIIGLFTRQTIPSLDSIANTLPYAILKVILGLVAMASSKYVKTIMWDILLIVVGLIVYVVGIGFPWVWGSIAIILGGVLGITARLT